MYVRYIIIKGAENLIATYLITDGKLGENQLHTRRSYDVTHNTMFHIYFVKFASLFR